MSEPKLKTILIPKIAGVTDLSNVGPGDQEASWWTPGDWSRFEAEEPLRRERDEKYIAELKEKGEFGKEYNLSFSVVQHPLFDEQPAPERASYGYYFLDLSKK